MLNHNACLPNHWPAGGESGMIELTCRHHQGARYLTKPIFGRSLHFVEADASFVRAWYAAQGFTKVSDEVIEAMRKVPTPSMECRCPASDLIQSRGL